MDLTASPSVRRLNVLTLDGGGIRGISSLLILQDLMREINACVRQGSPSHLEVAPHEIFDLAGGTSTGGLIAIMLGKLGMSLEACVKAYDKLSTTIFSAKHRRARLTAGLAPAKYSGSVLEQCVRQLLKDNGFIENLPMENDDGSDKIACAVVCREHQTDSRYSDYKPNPVCICSLSCRELLDCLVYQAARATSAAPTYFPIQRISGRSFADGGIAFNNPTLAIYQHYSQPIHVAESRRTSIASYADLSPGIPGTSHGGGLDFSQIRIVNLGTGTEPTVSQIPAPGFFAKLLPAPVRMLAWVKRTLKKTATSSEGVAGAMRTIARVSGVKIKYERFSEDTGICYIELDEYKELEKIKRKTRDYLKDSGTQKRLKRVAAEIAAEYLQAQRPQARPSTLAVPGRVPLEPQDASPKNPQSTHTRTTSATQSLARLSGDHSEISAATSSLSERADNTYDKPPSPPPVIPARDSGDIASPALSMVHSVESELKAQA